MPGVDSASMEAGQSGHVEHDTASAAHGSSVDMAETLPMPESWPPKPWIPKSDLKRWTTPGSRWDQPETESEVSTACFVSIVFGCNFAHIA